jgi:S-DNA-T family DNA segregation ATPase FtsK/SpoIIIE
VRFSVTAVDGASGRSADVLLDALPEQRVSDVLPALLGVLGEPVHPRFLSGLVVYVDGRSVRADQTIREAGLRAGARIALHEPDAWAPGLPTGVVELRVVSGPGAGRIHRIGLGEHVIGCGGTGMSLPDLLLPENALTVAVDTDGELTIVEATVPVRIDGEDPEAPDEVVLEDPAEDVDNLPEELLTRRERAARHRRNAHAEVRPTVLDWPRGADLRIGQTVLQWHHVWQPDADVSASTERLGVDFNRPPRMLPPVRESSFVIPAEPTAPRAQRIPWAMVLAPVVMAGPMALLFGSPRYLVLAALSPVMALFNWVLNRRGNAQDHRQRMIEYKTEDRAVRRRIARAWTLERDDVRREQPDAAELLLQAVGPGQSLWVRRRRDPDYLTLRVGVADRPSSIAIRDRARKETDEPRPPHALGDVPVGVRMRQEGVIGLCGDGAGVDALSRWMVGQAAVLHSPDDLRIVVLTGAEREDQWDWLRWLPHCRANDEPVGAFIGTEQGSVSRRVGELGQILAARGRGDGLTTQADIPPRPDFLVVLDGARRLRTLPGVVQLLREGPAAGIHVICLDEDPRSLPEECRGVLQVSEGLVEFRRTGSEAVSRISPDLVEQAWSERIGRALAPVRDTTPDEQVTGLPSSARLLDSVRMPDPTPDQIRHRWGPQAQTEVVIGEGFDGPFRLDLRKDGPHALIAGTTGSGKSEFLQTVVASLAISNSPEQMTFVLVDYKGGSAFKDCARLPHTVGMVTDLDTHLVGRALTSLGAELRRREHLLAVPGAKDLEDYWALQRSDPSLPVIPRLAIVIDEFASLKSELPEFVDGLVTIAQRGRSLGIHLVLATQRPSGVISNDIRANTNLRIALRVTDEAESRDVIDAPDAATIGASQPGRGYARLGHSSLLPFQSGRVGGARPSARTDAAELPPPLAWPLPWNAVGMPAPARPKAEGGGTDEGETDLKVLVEAIQGANDALGLAPMHSPWLPSLPPVVSVAALREREAAAAETAAPDRVVGFSAPWAIDDVPAEQAQRPRRFVLGASGHLFVVGGARSGRSTALRTIAAALAESTPSRDLHLYGLDCGNGALLPLTALPHTGAVVQRTEVERAGRLLDRLLEEVKRRQDVLGRDGFADIDEQRQAVEPDARLPYVLLLLDRWEGFVSDLSEVDLGRLNDAMLTLLREGASVGVQVLITGDRLLLSGRVAGLVESKLLLRLPDRTDYSLAGLKVRDVPENLAEGRGLWAESGLESQIAVLGDDVSGAAQSTYVRELGARLRSAAPAVPPGLRPFSLAALPSEVSAESVLSGAPAVAPGTVPVGVGGDGLDLLGVEAVQSPALVVGPPRSGRTNSLLFAARWAVAQDRQILGFTPAENALTALLGALGAECVTGTSAGPDEVVKRLQELRDGALVLIDDAERLRDADMAPVLMALVRQARDRDFHVLIAGGTAELAAGYSGWITEARKGRKGVVLSPMEALAGDVFGGRVGRMSILPRLTPGRGVLFDGTGDQIPVQTPRCDGAPTPQV